MYKKLIILDRDGVINEDSDDYIKDESEWHIINGSDLAISQLCEAGFYVAVATNQSGISRGYFDEAKLEKIHKKMHHKIAAAGGKIADIAYCPHLPDDNCECRKPKPGLLQQISENLDHHRLDGTYFIGDSISDIKAARAAACRPVLVLTGKGSKTLAENSNDLMDVPIYDNLFEAVSELLSEDNL